MKKMGGRDLKVSRVMLEFNIKLNSGKTLNFIGAENGDGTEGCKKCNQNESRLHPPSLNDGKWNKSCDKNRFQKVEIYLDQILIWLKAVVCSRDERPMRFLILSQTQKWQKNGVINGTFPSSPPLSKKYVVFACLNRAANSALGNQSWEGRSLARIKTSKGHSLFTRLLPSFFQLIKRKVKNMLNFLFKIYFHIEIISCYYGYRI